MADAAKKRPWLVRTHHRLRTVSFALLFAATFLQIADRGYGWNVWLLLGLMLLVYPQIQNWRAARAADPIRTEMAGLTIDSALLGVYAAAIQFPLWLSFSALLGTLVNNAVNKGWRGSLSALAAFLGGAAIGGLAFGFAVAPQTEWATAVMCVLGLSAYLVAIGDLVYMRNGQLRAVREDLKRHKDELLAANQTLRDSLAEIGALQQQLSEQAVRDPLTGLYNRRYLDSTLEREVSRCKRDGRPLSLIIIDVDRFKTINDNYGHQAGDQVLKALGEKLMRLARSEDFACRYGGEEFLLLMPTMPLWAARERAEELRAAFADCVVPFGSFGLQATLSIGVAAYPGHGSTADDLVRCADGALYLAKQGGRNQVQVAPAPADATEEVIGGNLVQLVWHPAFESGNALIDEQHRALFAQVNRLLSALITQRPAAEVEGLVDRLFEDVREHFDAEEALIVAAGYPNAAEHAQTHAEFLTRARTLTDGFHAGQCQLGEIFQFMAHDVIARHMLGADRAFFPYLARQAASVSES